MCEAAQWRLDVVFWVAMPGLGEAAEATAPNMLSRVPCLETWHLGFVLGLLRHPSLQVCDFNLSRVMEETVVLSSMAASNPRWLAPEILGGKGYSFSSDVYSFGMIMWEFLTWQVPWHDCGPWQVRLGFGPLRLCGMSLHSRALCLLQAPGACPTLWLCCCMWCQQPMLQGALLKSICHDSMLRFLCSQPHLTCSAPAALLLSSVVIPAPTPATLGLQVVALVTEGQQRPELPPKEDMPGDSRSFAGLDEYIQLMHRCWHQVPESRPTFAEVS